jgi:hypothetical protein
MRSVVVLAALAFVVVCLLAMAWTMNPGISEYRTAVLLPHAKTVVAKWVQADRQVIEEQATKVLAAYHQHRVVHVDGVKLALLKTVPGLRMEFTTKTGGGVGDVPTRLSIWKHHAMIQIALGQDSAEQSLTADLAFHTTRRSYGLASVFMTCESKSTLRYVGFGGRFSSIQPAICDKPARR